MNTHTQEKTEHLLAQYRQYCNIESTALADPAAKIALKRISDSMKFDTPHIWLAYKMHAYTGTPTELTTLEQFLTHCTAKDSTCGKRLSFLAKYLCAIHAIDITNQKRFPPSMKLADFVNTLPLQQLEHDPIFMKTWIHHEYHEENGKTAKWTRYKPEEK